ncbi:uncharacterized protein LOC111099095 isoform X2 [Crassostrea virginica]
MTGMDYCTVLPSWDFDKDPATVIEYCFGQETSAQADEGSDEASFQQCQDLNPRNCLQLTRVEGEDVCTVTLTCKPQYHVSICGLHLYSQARLVEVYDASEGYLKTMRGQGMRVGGDGEGGEETEVVNRCRTSLDTCYGLTIKFPRLQDSNFLKIYKIVFILHPEPEEDGSELGHINMSKVRSYVTSLGDDIPEGARGLMHSMEEFQQNQRSSMGGLSSFLGQRPTSAGSSPLGMMGLMSILSQMGVNSNQQRKLTSSSQLNSNNSSLTHSSQSNSNNSSQGATGNQTNSNTSETSEVFSFLHNICDKVSGLREEDKRKAQRSDEAEREVNGIATENSTEESVQKQKNREENTHEELRSEDNSVSIGHQALSEARLEALENRLLHHIDSKISEMERRINSRLDEILNLLSSKSISESKS